MALPATAEENNKSRVYLRVFYQAVLTLTKLLRSVIYSPS